jgi:tRNA dimethylallyltransferase
LERKVIVIVGPTCSGKTGLAFQLATKVKGEIISADSRQIYKYLNIGTAKPEEHLLNKVKHYFIDQLDPDEDYNVSKFEKEALKTIAEIFRMGKQPIVAGGTGLYVKGLIDGIFDTADTDEEYRFELMDLRHKYGDQFLYDKLMQVDPESAAKMESSNWKRVIRALEVHHITGEKIGVHQKLYERREKYYFIQFGLNWERKILYNNIEMRVDEMIKAGLVDEVENIIKNGYNKNLNSLNTVGYKEIISYLENEISLERAIDLIKRNTRRYAKRQMTWFRKDQRIKWYDVRKPDDLNNICEQLVNMC